MICGILLLVSSPEAAPAQDAQDRGCVLVLQPTESTRSQSRRVGPELYVTHIGGGMRWTCGESRMVADSAVHYDREERLVMIGDVDYRDSIRTLTSERLTYFEREDRLLAEREVVLTRLASGSVLRGPRVQFFRSMEGEVRRTVATGRPHLTLPPENEGDPAEVRADSLVMLGDEVAWGWGDVRIERPDMTATADSAFFRMTEGLGELYGSPVVTGEEYRLSGDTIRTRFADGELRETEALGDARAEGEDYELFSERIRAHLVDETIERLRAVGAGPSVALSVPYRLSGDSLDFAFTEGDLDSLVAVGGASAVEIEDRPEDPLAEIPLAVSGERSWVTGDTLTFLMGTAPADPSAARGPREDQRGEDRGEEPVAAEEREGTEEASERRLERIRAVGDARAYYLLGGGDGEGEDGAATEAQGRRERNYLIGREIEILFESGTVSRVIGQNAIGIYLGTLEEGA